MVRYKLKDKPETYSKDKFIEVLSSRLKATIISPNIDDEIIRELGGEVIYEDLEVGSNRYDSELYRLKLERNRLLSETDWIEKTTVVPKTIRDKYVVWRQLLRDIFVLCPTIRMLPPAPPIETKTKKIDSKTLSDSEIEAIKNHKTKDAGWLLFLDYWQHTGYTNNTCAVRLLIEAYSSEKINEIINGV